MRSLVRALSRAIFFFKYFFYNFFVPCQWAQGFLPIFPNPPAQRSSSPFSPMSERAAEAQARKTASGRRASSFSSPCPQQPEPNPHRHFHLPQRRASGRWRRRAEAEVVGRGSFHTPQVPPGPLPPPDPCARAFVLLLAQSIFGQWRPHPHPPAHLPLLDVLVLMNICCF